MADTRQIVSWAVRRPCAFRSGDQWFLPGQTARQLADLRTIASGETEGRNVDGISVTSWTTGQDNSGSYHEIPRCGIQIEKQLAHLGGLSKAVSTCRACEANAKTEFAIEVAGCFGYLDVRPDSEELDKELWNIIQVHHLEQRLRSAFPVTTPLWYGFWIISPLRRLQIEFLHDLLAIACDYDKPEERDLRHFLNALKAAIRWELPVDVELAPLGHTDFGLYTVFPHCPRCKANAHVGRWREDYSATSYQCHVCAHSFNPDEHHSSEQDDRDGDSDSLEKQLSEEGYQRFVRTFLMSRGCSSVQVDEVMDNKRDGPLLRQISKVREQRNMTLQQLRKEPVSKPDASQPALLSFSLAENVILELRLIPAGEFIMGSSSTDEQPAESPKHQVRIERPFYMGCFSVTQSQWTAVMGNNRSKHRGSPDLPVDQASWLGCQEFCERLCRRFGRAFRLPNEAEWEYACRAGTTTKYAWGEILLPDQANFTPYTTSFGSLPPNKEAFIREMELAAENAESSRQNEVRPVVVGSYLPNAWGLYDMHGNVDEWCEDVWHPDYHGAPADGRAWLDGEDKEAFRVVRGGWCAGTEFVCTSSARRQLRADAGAHEDDDQHDENEKDAMMEMLFELMYMPVGFRVVCET